MEVLVVKLFTLLAICIYIISYFHVIPSLTVENDKFRESKEIYYIRKFNPAFNEKATLLFEQGHSRMPGHTKNVIMQLRQKH